MNEINDLKELRYRTIDADRTLMARLRHYVYFLRETGLKKTIKKTYIKARFGDRIKYHFYSEVKGDYMILPLLIQPLVENAFVHGVEASKGGGRISIRVCAPAHSDRGAVRQRPDQAKSLPAKVYC